MKPLSPRTARSKPDEQLLLQATVKEYGPAWCLHVDGENVQIDEQFSGEAPRQRVKIPRRAFNALIDWYNRPQKPRRRQP